MAVASINKWLLAGQNDRADPVHRQLLHISGSAARCYTRAHALLTSLPSHIKTCWAGPGAHPVDRLTSISHVTQLLGQEFDIAVYDAHQPFRPSALMALAGTIRKGGRLILLTPPRQSWHQTPEVLAAHFLSFGYTLTDSPYLKRLSDSLSQPDEPGSIASWHDTLLALPVCRAAPDPADAPAPFATQDQANTFAAIQPALDEGNTAVVVTAPRGRGKSVLLGLLATELLKKGCNVALTSPVTHNSATLFDTIRQHADAKSCGTNAVQFSAKHTVSRLTWYAPDNPALRNQHRYLMIDEAASLPLPVMKQLALQADSLILATTTHGYEGSGQGFLHRFLPWISTRKTLLQHQLSAPIRWYQGDPLERFCHHVLLLSAPIQLLPKRLELAAITWSVMRFSEMSEALLRQSIQLLCNAHYQTSPDDIMRLIDAPDSFTIVGTHGDLIVAVCAVNQEGGDCLTSLAKDISAGRRRVKGHLAAQRLALLTASPELATHHYWRINRVAVQPDYQSLGIGSQCLAFIYQYAKERGIDALLSSFGATDSLLTFWRRNQLEPVHRGVKVDKASGVSSALVIRPLCNALQSEMPLLLRLCDYDTGVRPITDVCEQSGPITTQCLSIMVKRLTQFAEGARNFDQLGAAWWYFTCNTTEQHYRQLTSLKTITDVASAMGLSGKKAAQQVLRQAVSEYLSAPEQ